MKCEEVIKAMKEGYKVYSESYYGVSLVEDVEEIEDIYDEVECDKYLQLIVKVDEEAKEIHLIVEDDE
jgi:hypothetical protein